jgi:nucleoside phosphorylase
MRNTKQPNVQLDAQQYTVALICPLSIELTAARLMLDGEHKTPRLNTKDDDNTYTCGSINGHNVVIASLPQWHNGPISASHLINPLTRSFPNLRATLLVGIGGGIPQKNVASDSSDDIHLGDVVVGWDGDKRQAVIHWESRSILPQPDRRILNMLTKLVSNCDIGETTFPEHLKRCTQHSFAKSKFAYPGLRNDKLYEPNHHHVAARGSPCDACGSDRIVRREERKAEEFQLHFGTIACVDRVVDDPERRDKIRDEVDAVCVEMEAAGILGRQNCLVIRGISDYADSHKNEVWKGYAAATAAAVVREILYIMDPGEVNSLPVPGEFH